MLKTNYKKNPKSYRTHLLLILLQIINKNASDQNSFSFVGSIPLNKKLMQLN
jgi:hypothetical protein